MASNGLSAMWLNSEQLSDLSGISSRNTRRALTLAVEGKKWRGCTLDVKTIPSVGSRGKQYLVHVDSLPDELRNFWYSEHDKSEQVKAEVVENVTPNYQNDPTYQTRLKEAVWRFDCISKVLNYDVKTRQRRQAIKDAIAHHPHHPTKGKVVISESQIYEWLDRYHHGKDDGQGGIQALMRKSRKDTGAKRMWISKNWDKAAVTAVKEGVLSEDQVAAIRNDTRQQIASLWAHGAPGWRKIVEYGTRYLVDRCAEDGFDISEVKNPVNRRVVEHYRQFHLIDIKNNDAKLFFDVMIPRITRSRGSLKPMDLVIGDVHPIDVKTRRDSDDGEVYPRGIAWHDVATNRVFFTVHQCEKGKGINQMHIGESFAEMCAAWGLPKRLYLDNGSEYNWTEMLSAFSELSRLTHSIDLKVSDCDKDTRSIIRARPYNAPAKAIEGLFAVLERSIKQITGYVGGDRQSKKIQNVGKEPAFFPGNFSEFKEQFSTVIEGYHKRPQTTLKNRSPNHVLSDFINDGWGMISVSETALLFAFSDVVERLVDRGRITVNNVVYFHETLLSLPHRSKLILRVPRHMPDMVFCFPKDNRNLICIAMEEQIFDYLDRDGAKEQNRRATVLRQDLNRMEKMTKPIDMIEEQRKWNKTQPDAPKVPVRGTAQLSTEVDQMVAAANALNEKRADEYLALNDAAMRRKNDPDRYDQFYNADEEDELLNRFPIIDDDDVNQA